MSILFGLGGIIVGIIGCAIYNHFNTKKFDDLGNKIVDKVAQVKAKV